jgi:hypothetical protein
LIVLDDDYISKRIVIENVTHYAYGQHADGEIGVWVAGQAGWYSIVPAKGYRPMHNDMVEAVDLLYFLVDRHRNQRPKRKRRGGEPTFEYLCDEVPLFLSREKKVYFNADWGYYVVCKSYARHLRGWRRLGGSILQTPQLPAFADDPGQGRCAVERNRDLQPPSQEVSG